MGVTENFSRNFGSPAQAQSGQTAEREPTKVWINVGMRAGEGENERFVSLPKGIPLDDMKAIPLRGTNEDFNAFTAGRNDLLADIKAIAEQLAPGDEAFLSLEVQVRRIAETNPYRISLLAKN
jgi:2-methylcitrate dehydratase PrpD